MILKGDILKNSLRQKGVAALEKLPSPSVRCHFDDGQDYYGKNSSAPLFSWHVKGDSRLPLLPVISAAALLGCAAAVKTVFKHKHK